MIDDREVMDRAHAGSNRGKNKNQPWQHHAISMCPSCVYNQCTILSTEPYLFIYCSSLDPLSCGRVSVKPMPHQQEHEKCVTKCTNTLNGIFMHSLCSELVCLHYSFLYSFNSAEILITETRKHWLLYLS